MSAMIEAPVDLLEAVAELHLPRQADQRLQELMDQNTEGGPHGNRARGVGRSGRMERGHSPNPSQGPASARTQTDMSSWSEIVQLVATRAGQRCEYCRMHQALQGATFHIEHIVPQSRGGTSEPSNLALSCPSCNLHKSDRLQIADPDSNTMVSLFNPRIDSWSDHFRWQEYQLVGLTSVGKATVVCSS